jgi:hypothetical protein
MATYLMHTHTGDVAIAEEWEDDLHNCESACQTKYFYYLHNETKELYSAFDLEELYGDMLDECWEPVNICGYEYAPSVALHRVDRTAYEVGFSDFIADCYEEVRLTQEEIDNYKPNNEDEE